MARDEALLAAVGRGDSPPTLRLYEWTPPTVSLGYFQPFALFESLEPPAGALAVVRRLTGGGAILHDQELTYALTLPVSHRLLAQGADRLYEIAHRAITSCLTAVGSVPAPCGVTDDSGPRRGPFFCFARRHRFDLLVGSDKLAGSAQRRAGGTVLQHGSIILGNRFPQQPTAAAPLPFDQALPVVRAALPDHFAEATGETLEAGVWFEHEWEAADKLVDKYAGVDWTRRC
jgi:lipoate-protein ligase A